MSTYDVVDKSGWLIDSDESNHMARRRDWFYEFEEFKTPVRVKVGNGEEIKAYGKGKIQIETFVNSESVPGMMYDVLYVPDLNRNLFSVKVVA